MRMTAAVMYEQGLPTPYGESQPFRIEEVDLEGPGEGEVLVEVRAAGLCHSDLSVVAGLRKRTLPVVGGHEGAGVVVEVGRGVHGARARRPRGDDRRPRAAAIAGPASSGGPSLCDNVGAAARRGHAAERRAAAQPRRQAGLSLQRHLLVRAVRRHGAERADQGRQVGAARRRGDVRLRRRHRRRLRAERRQRAAGAERRRVRAGRRRAELGDGGADRREHRGSSASTSTRRSSRWRGSSAAPTPSSPPIPSSSRRSRTSPAAAWTSPSRSRAAKAAMKSAVAIARKGGEVVCVGLGASADLYEYAHAALVAEEKVFRGSIMGSERGRARHPALSEVLQRGPAAGRQAQEREHGLRRAERQPRRAGPTEACFGRSCSRTAESRGRRGRSTRRDRHGV